MRYRILLVDKNNSGLKYVYSINISGYPAFQLWDKNLPESWIYTFYDEDSAIKKAKAAMTNNSTWFRRMAVDIDDLKKYSLMIFRYHNEGWYAESELTMEAKV